MMHLSEVPSQTHPVKCVQLPVPVDLKPTLGDLGEESAVHPM